MFFRGRRNVTLRSHWSALMLVVSAASAQAGGLALHDAEQQALAADTGQRAFQIRQKAFLEQAVAADTWMDPTLSIGTMNLPGNDLDPLNRGMIELKLEQMLPRGKSNQLQRQKAGLQSEASEIAARERRLQVLQSVRLAWLDMWYWQQASARLKADTYLFESLVDVTESLYSQGRKKQQDFYRAEVELTRLNDRLVTLNTGLEQSRAQLARWLGGQPAEQLAEALPELALEGGLKGGLMDSQPLLRHPLVRAADVSIQQSEQDVALAREGYKPQFGIELKYGREQMAMGADSRDKFSAMVMMDLPLFTGDRQDRQLTASQYQREASVMDRQDLLQQLQGKLSVESARYTGLTTRVELYQDQLLPRVNQQAEAALRAYQSDAGEFNEVIEGYRSRLNASLEYIRLQADLHQSAARLHYLLPSPQGSLKEKAIQGQAIKGNALKGKNGHE